MLTRTTTALIKKGGAAMAPPQRTSQQLKGKSLWERLLLSFHFYLPAEDTGMTVAIAGGSASVFFTPGTAPDRGMTR